MMKNSYVSSSPRLDKGHGKSLFFKYMMFFAILEAISLTVFGCLLMYFVADSWKDEQKQSLFNYTKNISETYSALVNGRENGTKVSYEGLCYSISSVSSTSHADVFITDTNGKVIFCKDMANTNDANTGKCTCKTHSGFTVPGELYTGILADGMLATIGNFAGIYQDDYFVSAAVAYDSQQTPCGIVFATQSIRVGLLPYMSVFLRLYIMSALLVLILTGFFIYLFTYRVTSPLRQMSEATLRYSKGDFSYRIRTNAKKSTAREFGELAEAMNLMAASLETLEKSRGNFVANVSHELKTPMTTIGGFIDGILDGTIDSEHQDYYLKIVSDEVKRLSRLVISMLNMSKMESGELRLNPVKYSLTQQIVGIFLSFEQKISDKKINVKGLDNLQNHYIEADKDMINQVFYNLIDNAVKFTEDGGEISLDMQSEDAFVTVKIRNTGKGIDSEDIKHVFERFYKGDKSRSLDSKSAGLGLFIVKNIVELHNGTISVKNIDDRYTEFEVRLKIKLIGY